MAVHRHFCGTVTPLLKYVLAVVVVVLLLLQQAQKQRHPLGNDVRVTFTTTIN